jgi:hypothetical protein
MIFKKKKDKDGHNHGNHKVTTADLLKQYLSLKINKMSPNKKPVNDPNRSLIDQMDKAEINHVAIILDGVVEDVIRCQNRMAALLLSEPKFVEFDPSITTVQIGTEFKDDEFIVKDGKDVQQD